jgi:hypothetical protein
VHRSSAAAREDAPEHPHPSGLARCRSRSALPQQHRRGWDAGVAQQRQESAAACGTRGAARLRCWPRIKRRRRRSSAEGRRDALQRHAPRGPPPLTHDALGRAKIASPAE